MKKSLFIIVMLLCVALFALPALATETTCEHDLIYCNGTCTDCGTEGLTAGSWHKYEKYQNYDESYHQEVCTLCGNVSEDLWDHNILCNGTCSDCGADGLTANPENHNYKPVYYDENSHWDTCTVCGVKGEEAYEHWAVCTAVGICTDCGGTIPEDKNVTHWGADDASNETHHWRYCHDCGGTWGKAEHYVYCNSDGHTCDECGQGGLNLPVTHVGSRATGSNETEHWEYCGGCGEEYTDTRTAHTVDCTTPGVCTVCGASCTNAAEHVGSTDGQWYNDDTSHWQLCACGEKLNEGSHSVSCANPGVCTECGATDCTNAAPHSFEVVFDETKHWEECSVCGEIGWEGGEHFNVCISGLPLGRCVECDYDQTTTFYHTYDGGSIGEEPQTTWNHNETECWKECVGCNAEMADTRFPHHTSCTRPGVCTACGTEVGDEIEMMHYRYADTPYEYDETHHWFICVMCNEQAMKGEHKFRESERDESKVVYTCGCGATKEEQLHVEHVWIESARVEATCGVKGKIVYICECGETKTEEIPALEHSYTTTETPATCGVEGKKVTTCAHCGNTTTEVIPALKHEYVITSMRQPTCTAKGVKEVTCEHCDDEIVTYIDVVAHSYAVTSETAATCEQDGAIVSTCTNCGDEQTEAIPATGHAYGVYAPAGDGTHVAECNTCGATRVRDCEYQDVETNGITLTVCSVCGHTRYAEVPVEAAEGTVEPDTLFVPTKVAAATAVTTAGEELQSGVQLVIYDQTAMLQEGSPILAMYTLGLESDGYAVKPQSALRVELPLTEGQTAETFAQHKLVIIALDGTMTEIEYVIEEGKIIFETELVGILAFLPIEE